MTIEAETILARFRIRVDECRRRSTIEFDDVLNLRTTLTDIAIEVFGRDSEQMKDAQISILNPRELRKLEVNPKLPPVVQSGNSIPRIIPIPSASRTDYYRKRLDELDEIASSFLFQVTHFKC